MSQMWTSDAVARMMETERDKASRDRAERLRPRIDAIRVVDEAMKKAHLYYVNRYAMVKRDFDMGLIGPSQHNAARTCNEAWIAAEVRRRLIDELNDESPIRREDEYEETDQ